MAEAIELKQNCHLINAPAGSGKTTKIKKMIQEIIVSENQANILCITFTNRAADELNKEIKVPNVTIQTIHAFIHSFMNIYFKHQELIELYLDIYKDEIIERIENKGDDEKIKASNEKYKEIKGDLSFEFIKKNLNELYYNELQFSSLYNGGLSHDALLEFTNKALEKYPKINKRIAQKYDYIFIDEYQDSSADILNIFHRAVEDERSQLYLFGDKMQQIYKNYDGSFENTLETFQRNEKLEVNYRSTVSIVRVLNNIYNDPEFVQSPQENEDSVDSKPLVYMCRNIKESVKQKFMENQDALRLVIYNKERFNSIGAGGLFSAVSNMQKYAFGRKYNAVNVLTTNSRENPDILFSILFMWENFLGLYEDKKYGLLIQEMKNSKYIENKFEIITHNDKIMLNIALFEVFDYFQTNGNGTIFEWIELLKKRKLISQEAIEGIFESDEYKEVLQVSIQEFKELVKDMSQPTISTQHGVKGEGHDKVFFIAQDSSNPSVKIYDFFKLWINTKVVFSGLQNLYYQMAAEIEELEKKLEFKISNMKKENFERYQGIIDQSINKVNELYGSNECFQEIYGHKYDEYGKSKRVGKAKECLNINNIYGILSAYKLFYVGCSRARKDLNVFIDNNKIKGDKRKLIQKFQEIGFEVVEC